MNPKLPLGLLSLAMAVGSSVRANGQSWTLTSAPITNWISVACSADGSRVVAAANGGSIYQSTDSGRNWSPTAAPTAPWLSLACSADGTNLIAAAGDLSPTAVYLSTNSGVSWTTAQISTDSLINWRAVTCSADFRVLVAGSGIVEGEGTLSQIFVSTNSGNTWTGTNFSLVLSSVACSANGSKIIASCMQVMNPGGAIHGSTDWGATWQTSSAPPIPWKSVASSGDGSRFAAAAYGDSVYFSSDSGVSWPRTSTPIEPWTAVASSANGARLTAAAAPGPIYTSADSGTTWLSNTAPVTNWSAVATSADGNTLVAAVNGGRIYTWHAPPPPGTVLWTYDAGANISSSPAVAPEGSIVFGTDTGLVAVTNGSGGASNKWTFAVSNSISSSPAIALDGTVYFLNSGVGCYALNPEGTLKWSFPFQTTGLSSPAVGADGTVYVVGDGSVYAITSTGAKKWATSISSQDGSPVLSPEGTIYVATGLAGGLAALNPDGSTKWAIIGSADGTGQSAAIGANGTVYVGNAAGLAAFDPAGNLLWYSGGGSSQGFGWSSPVIAKDGTIYMVETATLNLYAFNSSGQANLTFVPGSGWKFAHVTVPAIDAQGLIYYYGATSVYAVTPQGQVQWMVPVGGGVLAGGIPVTSPVIGGDGTIYFGVGTELFAIAGTNALGDTPWPMFRQNARHTGKMERPTLALPQKGTDFSFTFRLYPNQIGLTYTIESSTNLSSWATMTNVLATTLPTTVTDLSASNAPARFYRASLVN